MKKLLLLFFLLIYASGFSQPTVMPTTPPTRTAGNVLSIFSGAYTNQTGVSFPTFGGTTLNSDLALSGSPAGFTKSYTAHSFSGIQVNTAGVLDVSGMTHLHLDVYSTNYTSMAIKLESSTTTARELAVTGSVVPSSTTRNQWISLDLALSTYNTGNILTSLKYIVPVTFGQNATLFITNVYFYKPETPTFGAFTVPAKVVGDAAFTLTPPTSNSAGAFTYTSSNTNVAAISGSTVTLTGAVGTSTITVTQAANGIYAAASTTASLVYTLPSRAPIPPARGVGEAVTIYSNIAGTLNYPANIAGSDFNPTWGQGNAPFAYPANHSKPVLSGDEALGYYNVQYQGINIGPGGSGTAIGASMNTMTHVHFDVLTANFTGFDFRLIDGFDRSVLLTTTLNQWTSFDIPLSSFSGLTKANISQIKVQRNPFNTGTDRNFYYLDNIYFYNATAPEIYNPTATAISATSATLGANITSAGSSAITSRGTSFSTTTPVLVGNNQQAAGGTATGVFTSVRSTAITPQTLYYYVGYAINGTATRLSPEDTFRSLSSPPTAQPGTFSTAAGNATLTPTWIAATFPGSGATRVGYLLLYSTGTPALIASPNGLAPASAISVGTNAGLADNTVPGSLALTTTISGLTNGTPYNLLIVPYTWDGTNTSTYNYFTAGALTSSGTPIVIGPPTFTSPTATGITNTSATLGATITYNGGTALTIRGTAYKTTAGVSAIDNALAEGGTAVSAYSHVRNSPALTPQTQYFYVGYATNGNPNTGTSAESSFRTLSNPPTSQPATFTVTPGNANLVANWGAAGWPAAGATSATQAGYAVIWALTGTTPTLSAVNGTAPTAGAGTLVNVTTALSMNPAVTTTISGLANGSLYNLLIVPYTWDGANAATYNYLTLSARTTTGTPAINAPVLTTNPSVASITQNNASVTITVNSNGNDGGNLGSGTKGILWGTSSGLTSAASGINVSGGNALGGFTSTINGLNNQTLYYYRGTASNGVGYAAPFGYGPELSFRTLSSPATVQPSAFSTTISSTTLTPSWTAATFPGSGATNKGYLLLYSTGTPALIASPNGLAPASAISVGTNVGLADNTVAGSLALTTTITGLINGTLYNLLIIPYTWDGTNISTYNYFTAGARTTFGTPSAAAFPTLNSPTAVTITATSAVLGANVTGLGTGGVSVARGTAFKITSPVIATDNQLQENTGQPAGVYSHNRGSLSSQTQYFYVGYATNTLSNTGISSEGTFRTLSSPATVQPATFTAANGAGSITANWGAAAFPGSGATRMGYLLLYSKLTPALITLPNGLAPASAISVGTNAGLADNTVAASLALSTTITGVTPGTYNLLIVPYTWDGTNTSTYNYFTSGARTTTATLPALSYTWNAVSGAWTTPANWNPVRTSPDPTDFLNFTAAAGATQTVNSVPTEVIGRLSISGAVTVLLQTGTSNKTLTIASDGTATDDLSVGVGSTLLINSTGNSITTNFTSGATATIAGTLEINNTNATNLIDFSNCVMTVTGKLAGGTIWTPNPWVASTPSSLKISGTYEHKYTTDQGFLPAADWNPNGTGSLLLISGTTSVGTIGNFAQSFYDVTWNCPGQTSNFNFGVTGFVGATNTFTVASTGTGGTAGSIILNKTSTVKNFTQTGGTFNFSTGTAGVLNVTGDYSQTAGAIQATSSSGTFNFNGGALQTYTSGGTLSGVINNSITNNSTIDFGTSVISSGSTGTFNLASGAKIITANANGLTASGASGTVQSSGTRTYSSGASYEFKGANTGNFNLSTANTITGTLSLNSASGNINVNQSLSAATLDITNNVVTTGANTLTLASGGTYSRTTGYVNGTFRKFIPAASASRTFEIGNATNYLPLTLNFTGAITAGGSITASATAGDHPQIVSSSINSNKSLNKFFTITSGPAVPGLTSYSPVFNYLSGENDGLATPANYGIQTYNGISWTPLTVTPTPSSTTATATGVTSFGDFAIGESKTTPTVTVTVGTYTYNTASQGPNSISAITPAPASVTYSYTGVSLTYGPSATAPTKAGSYTATATVVEDANYPTTPSAPTAFVIGQKELTVTGAVSQDKEYNTTATAIISGGSLVGVLGLDDVLLIQNGTFPSKNVGTNLVVTASCTLTGTVADVANYFLTQPIVNTANITPKEVTINNLATADKVYDKTNVAILTDVIGVTELQGEFPSDTANVSFTPSGFYADANVGSWIITSTTVLTGSEAGNYILTQPTFSATKDITPVGLDVTGITADNKTYDGNADAVINTGGAALVGVLSGEELGVTLDTSLATGSFDTRDFGTGKTVTIAGLSISGVNASNYSINTTTALANIARRPITITATDQIKCAGSVFSSPGDLNVDFTKDYNVAGDIVSVTLTVIGGNGSISGSYPLRPSLPVPGASNYIVTPVDGVLTVNPSPTATVTGTVATCIGSAPVVTFTGALGAGTTGLGGTLQYEFTYKVGALGTPTTITTDPGSNSTFIIGSTNVSGAVNYILLGVRDIVSGCEQTQTGTATVTTGVCTQLRAQQCGQFVPAADTVIQASPVPGATQYRFEITLTTAPNTVTVFTWPNYYFNPTTVLGGGLAYGKEYNIRVKPFIGATEYPYGSVCLIKAPLVAPAASATTTVRPFQCGKTLTAINTFIEASPVVTATLYEFEVTDGSGTRFATSTLYYFNPMTGLVGGVQYGTAYSIRVRTFTGVNKDIPLTPWGAACTVTTPGLPFSKLVTTQCNKTVTSLTPRLNAASIFLADGYRFRIRLQSNPLSIRVVEKTSGNMTVLTAAELPGGYAAATTYLVDIAVRYSVSGQWQELYGGEVCTITTPIAKMNANLVDTIFNVKAFPNPFASHFSLDIESSSDAQVEMKVYDMIGRQLEVRKATVSELSVQEVGRNYPSGVYNVVVSQGDQVKSVRMVKR